ncbi:WXG100 family type VII secretion target [Nocardia sp. CWNU-33]|uniref:WXG100 family type VII secretion target n=1 Tax=Nocardia sp. CWNU-33 TaxID=3392117 RepID=UPI00398E8B1A
MKWDFPAIEGHTEKLGQIIQGMQDDANNVRELKGQLLATFSGKGAQGYSDVNAELERNLASYDEVLTRTKLAIVEAKELMQVTDKNASQGFLSI